jgi:hypothetical protein
MARCFEWLPLRGLIFNIYLLRSKPCTFLPPNRPLASSDDALTYTPPLPKKGVYDEEKDISLFRRG